MENQWFELSFPVPPALADLVADDLYALGCLGVNLEERALDTFVEPDPDADLPQLYRIRAYFPQSSDPDALAAQIRELQHSYSGWEPVSIERQTVAQQDWAEGWKQHFSASRFGSRLVVKPSWEEWDGNADDVVISLDPGMAFGTGSHETTRLCLQAIAELFAAQPVRSLLDVGTGSGILAMAAVGLGAERVLANDIDAEACRVAAENIAQNGMTGRVEVTTEPLEQLHGRFDVVIANILAEENVRLADHLVARLAPGGSLLLSGILREKEAFVRDGFARQPLTGPVVSYDADWCCLHYRRTAD